MTRADGGTRRDLDEVVAPARTGRLHAVLERCALEDGPAAFERLERGEVVGLAVLVP